MNLFKHSQRSVTTFFNWPMRRMEILKVLLRSGLCGDVFSLTCLMQWSRSLVCWMCRSMDWREFILPDRLWPYRPAIQRSDPEKHTLRLDTVIRRSIFRRAQTLFVRPDWKRPPSNQLEQPSNHLTTTTLFILKKNLWCNIFNQT